MNEIWLEKYRPKTFDTFLGQESVVTSIKQFIAQKDIPNMIFYGPPGTGKTSLVHIIIHEIFKSTDEIKDRVLELNASDERGIKVIRNTIKMFASYSICANEESIPIKIVFLDEADSLTLDSQFALRRIMEDYAPTTRFILTCNFLNKIIPPLVSRCSVLNFYNFDMNTLSMICGNILKKENIKVENIDEIITKNNLNIRQILNSLQSGNYLQMSLDIEWDFILSKDNINIYDTISTFILDGHQVDYLLISFTNWILKNDKTNYHDFFIKLSKVTSNIANRGTPLVNIIFIVFYYKYLLKK